MIQAFSILAVLLVAVTMGLALAHALEFPGKLRLDEQTYRDVQAIYYPGFTFGGLLGELGALLLPPVLLFLLPFGSDRFWWTASALACLVAGHAVYWCVTHPVNAVWLKDTDLRVREPPFSRSTLAGTRIGSTFAIFGSIPTWRGLRSA